MNINTLYGIIQTTGRAGTAFSVGQERDNQLVIMKRDGKWQIYHPEKGDRIPIASFDDEDDACRFYLRLVADLLRRNQEFLLKMADDKSN